MATINLERISKAFAEGHYALHDVSLAVSDGERLVIVGPSGSGKSTVLRLIAGLDAPTSGRILIDGQDVTAQPPQQRDVAMVFQSYALYPHKSVRDNLGFGLRMRGRSAGEIAARVAEIAAMLELEGLLDRRPHQLSGGQRQRVALGRAIGREPKAFLLDEPLSNLDPALRTSTRAELARLHRRIGTAMVYVTHDQEEAMTLGTRIAVMREGRVEQIGAPLDVYERPANTFIAGFVGAPAMNFLPCDYSEAEGGVLRSADIHLRAAAVPGLVPGLLTLGVRPQDVELTGPDAGDGAGRIDVVEPMGAATIVHLRAGTGMVIRVVVPSDARIAVDQNTGFRVRRDRLHFFNRDDGQRLR
jgi:multiple sugar transport system ATP-binding protein